MLPKITELEFEQQSEDIPTQGKSFLFDFKKGEFVLKDGRLVKTSDIEALKVWIEKVLRTEKFRFKIYEKETSDNEYGVTIEDLIVGQNLPRTFIESEIKREVFDGLIKHPMIKGISNFSIDRAGTKTVIFFVVNLIDNSSMEQEVNF